MAQKENKKKLQLGKGNLWTRMSREWKEGKRDVNFMQSVSWILIALFLSSDFLIFCNSLLDYPAIGDKV